MNSISDNYLYFIKLSDIDIHSKDTLWDYFNLAYVIVY